MKQYIYFMAVIAMLAISCSNAENKEAAADSAYVNPTTAKVNERLANDTLAYNDSSLTLQAGTPAPTPADWDKKLIKTARLNIELRNYDSFDNALHHQIRSYGAYIASEKQLRSESAIQNTVSIKVPVAQFDNLLNCLNGKGVIIKDKEISADDVTNSIVDTKARIEAKKRIRARYLELMDESKKMKDVLTVEEQLNNLQDNIEANTGQVNHLEHEAAFSTIYLSYYQPVTIPEVMNDQPGYWWKLTTSFSNGTSVLGNILLFAISIWPFLLIGSIVLVVYRKRRSQLKVQKSVQDA